MSVVAFDSGGVSVRAGGRSGGAMCGAVSFASMDGATLAGGRAGGVAMSFAAGWGLGVGRGWIGPCGGLTIGAVTVGAVRRAGGVTGVAGAGLSKSFCERSNTSRFFKLPAGRGSSPGSRFFQPAGFGDGDGDVSAGAKMESSAEAGSPESSLSLIGGMR